MAGLLCHLHFWTFSALAPSTVLNTGIHGYHHKTTGNKVDVEYCRKDWCEGRHVLWSLSNHRPNKLRDQLRECEELLCSQKILVVKWKTLRHLLILLESGVLILITICKQSGDIEGILIDRSLITKLNGALLDKALVLDNSIILLYAESNKISLICPNTQSRRGTNPVISPPTPMTINHENARRPIEKISSLDVKLFHTTVRGMPDKRIERNITSNSQKDLVSIWWKDFQEDGMQWSSLADGESDNILVIRIKSNGKLEVFAQIQTKHNPICLLFSKLHANLLYCIMTPGDFNYELHSLECQSGPSYNINAIITTNANVTAFAMNNDESFLLLGCDNGALVMYDMKKEAIKTSVAFFSPVASIRWHPAGSVVFIAGVHGEIQCVDASLNHLQFTVCNERNEQSPLLELGSYLVAPVLLEDCGWGSESRQGEGHGGCYDNFVVVFNKGPIVLMRIELGVASKGRLGNSEVLCEFLRHNQYSQACDLLLSTNESTDQEWLIMFTIFMDYFLTCSLPWCSQYEESMETVLGCYMSGTQCNTVDVTLYARRFFFKLLQHQKFEKAFRLAVDLNSSDIFMDLQRVAVQYNQSALAELCGQKIKLLMNNVGSGEQLSNCSSTEHIKSTTLNEISPRNHDQQQISSTAGPEQQQCINIVNFGYFS